MATKKAAAPPTTTGSPAPSGEKKVVGRPFPKGHPGGPGRPKLPDSFKSRAPKALKELLDIALGKQAVDKDSVRLAAIALVVEYYYGPAKSARVGACVPVDSADRIAMLEAVVADAAANGNAEAAIRMLEALDPTRWGKKQSEGGEDEQVDTVDFSPLVKA
jgi:hypothetical protein